MASLHWKRWYVFIFFKSKFPASDLLVQAWIITELLSTPPDDVIQTISSENVRRPPVPYVHSRAGDHDAS
jgi:hypothetical protein